MRLGDEGWQQVIFTLATGKGPTVLSLRDCWLDQEQVVVSFSVRPCLWSVTLAKQVSQRCSPWRSCPTTTWVWRRGRSTITRSSWPGLSTLILLQLFELGSRACNNTTFENISYVQGSNWRKHIKLTQWNVEVNLPRWKRLLLENLPSDIPPMFIQLYLIFPDMAHYES